MSQTRQLAAIMFADIMGYTAIMQADETLAMKLRDKLKAVLESETHIHKGKILKISGDGALCIFDSAFESIKAAIAVQLKMQMEPVVPLRVGVHQADVIFDGSDVFGDGVNIASRLESFAIPGSILFSAKVFDDIKNQKDIQTVSIGQYLLKNVKEPVEIFAVSNPGLKVPDKKKLEGKGIKYQKRRSLRNLRPKILKIGSFLLLLTITGVIVIPKWKNKQRARNEILPEIQKLAEASYLPSTKAFKLAKEAEKYIPKDSSLAKLWPEIANLFSFYTNPAGANVYWKDYSDITEEWKLIGKTPLRNIWIPQGFSRIKIEKPGFTTILSPTTQWRSELSLDLDSVGTLQENMVKVISSESQDNIIGLEKYKGKPINNYLIDKYEVTNKEYKRFVDAGGYNNKTYWNDTIISDDKEISWEKAKLLFVDKTGMAGPAGWEVGSYPDGKEQHPVTGISWYEAMAYARFAGKKLPTVYHWGLVADTWNASDILQKSNFNQTATVPVGILDGISFWGVYDIAGNAREWCFNEGYGGQRFILGGGWNDPPEMYNLGSTQSAFDRSLSNGFRCMKELPGDTTYEELSEAVKLDFRDYNKEKPVNNETFSVFLRQYAYDSSALNAKVTQISDSGFWKLEKIDMDAAYHKEKLTAYLFLPKNAKPPYQTVIFFPGSSVFFERNFIKDKWWPEKVFDFVLKSRRAILFPVIKGSFERGPEPRLVLLPEESILYKNQVVFWVQDVSRSIDYLQTRNDIVHDKFGFFSFSWGSTVAPVVCAVEKRIDVAVLHAPGFLMQKMLPEVDPLNFLPRVQIPVLMLNGENDAAFPLEATQKPMFNLLGTPEKYKRIRTYPGGHLVPRSELIKESLSWFEKYLGSIK